MNEPANFVAGDLNEGCAATATNYPPYLPHVIFKYRVSPESRQ